MITKTGVPYILIACFLWALDTLVRYPLVFGGLNISTIVFWEHLILALFFGYKLIPLIKKLDRRTTFLFFILGCGGSAAATLMFTKAFSLGHPTLVVLIQKTQPIFALLLASIWLKEKLTSRFLKLSFLALIGALVLISEELFNYFQTESVSISSEALLGYVLALGASILWGSSTVLGRYLSKQNFSASEMTTGRIFFALIFFLPMLATSFQDFSITQIQFGKILLMSFLSGFLGLLFYYKGLAKTKAKIASITEMSFPIWVILLNWIFLDQKLTMLQIGGAIILMASIYSLQEKEA